jgi:murein DD-endopeptidase MepM/ murein hydrolase activator NlpD
MRLRSLAFLGALLLATTGSAEPELGAKLDKRLAAVAKADEIVSAKVELRQRELRARVRAMYKLSRGGDRRLWVDGAQRKDALRRRVTARRIMRRDLLEIRALRDELDRLEHAELRLDHDRRRADKAKLPPRGSVIAPVEGAIVGRFGRRQHSGTGATLSSRGIRLSSRAGETVRAGIVGQVRFAGALQGIEHGVVLEHESLALVIVIGNLRGPLALRRGDRVDTDTVVGLAEGSTVYLETRLMLGAAGAPVDQGSLLTRNR